jgi:hypothetical protein
LENIVVKNSTIYPLFQIIDFGSAQEIQKWIYDQLPREKWTPQYINFTEYTNFSSILYDWHCVLLCVLKMLDLGSFDIGGYFLLQMSDGSTSNTYDVNVDILGVLLDNKLGLSGVTLKNIIIENWLLYFTDRTNGVEVGDKYVSLNNLIIRL